MGQSRSLPPGALAQCLSGLLSCALVILFGTVALAQSGRAPKPTTPPSPIPQTETTVKPTEVKPHPLAGLSLIATRNVPSANLAIWTGMAYRRFLERLSESPHIRITQEKEMNRKEASDLAKAATDTHVLWLEWDFDRMGSSSSNQSQNNSYINFYLYTPGTGKIKTSGRVHPGDYRARTGVGGVGIPLPIPNSAASLDLMLKESGREIAQRVIDSLNIGRPNH